MTLPVKERFDLPEGVIYLDGNSLGPLTCGAPERLARATSEEWGAMLIRGWNQAGWMGMPSELGTRIGRLIGAVPGSTVVGDTLSIKVFQALSAGLKMRPDRRVILSDAGNFPSDLYMAEGLIGMLGQGYELRAPEPEAVMDAISADVAVVMLTEVDYRTGRRHDMAAITRAAHAAGAVMVWDLAHSAGAIPVDIAGSNAEFAVGCTYKFLNGGPGAPAFIYIRPDIAEKAQPALSGWLGHRSPFDFELSYAPARGVERMRVGTPPVLQMAALSAALDVWDEVDMAELDAARVSLSELFIAEVGRRCPELRLISPADPMGRGSQVSFAYEHGYAAMQALIARGVIGDFRAPDVMRFGITPLYLDDGDIRAAAEHIERVVKDRLWDREEYKTRLRVT